MASSSLRAPPPPPLISLNSESITTSSSNGINRSSTSTSIHRNRPHSDSVSSRNSTVHFDLEDQAQLPASKPSPSRSSSKSSLKPAHPIGTGPGSANMVNGNSYQPVHPSTLHNSTIPSPPKSAPLLSTNSSSSSFMKPFPTDSPTSARPGLPKNRSSQDRRVWSETLPSSSRHRSGSMIAHGKRASRVTGGFETSSDSEGDESTTDQSTKDTGTGTGGNTPYQSENATAGPSRPRAKSLLGPTGRERQNSDASGTSRDLKRRKEKEKEKEKDEYKRPKKRSSKEPLPPSRMLSYRSTASPPKITPQLPNSKSDSYFGIQNGSSPRSSRMSTARSSPLIESTIPAPNGKSQISRGRSLEMLKERSNSPEGSKISKGKERESAKKRGDLAASLGLGIGGVQDMALNPEQLRNLLSDSDVSSALRLMNSPHAPASRPANLNDWSNSVFFSPPTTRPTSPGAEQPTHRSPYLVSAPPALTSSDNHGRERTMSVASTVAPPTRSTWGSSPRQRQSIDSHPSPEMQALHRRRASSKAGMMSDGQGGHVPFTHHLPVPSVDEGSPEQELDDVSDGLPAITENDSTALPSLAPTVSDKSSKEGKEKEKKSRLSNIFHIGKKKAPEAPNKHDHHLLHKDHRTDKQKEEDKAREREKYERDVERRRLEQERRDEELAQERRFRALTQVAAHPSAERLAYTEGARLRAFYSHVYEGVDDPPKLNPLAVIRWRIKTEEQTEARLRWEQEQQHDYQHSNKSDTSGFTNHASPHSLTRANHFGGNMHTSPMSVGSSSRYGPRKSVESNRSVSLGSLRKSTEKKGHDDKRRYEKGWGYSVDDIVNYKTAKGQVNYFIPPRRSHPDVEVLTEDEDRAFSPQPDTSGHNGRPGSRKDDQSSIADSSKKSHRHRMGVKTASNASLMDVEGIIGDDNVPLTRSNSIETNGHLGVPSKHRLTHRTHQSLSAVGPTSLTHALKQPFEKLSNVAKKQRNHGPSRDEGETQHIEDTKPRTYNHNRSDSAPSPHVMGDTYNHHHHHHHHTPMSNKPSRTTVNSSLGRTRDNNGLFRRHGTPGGAAGEFTDEEYSKDKEFHLRKLFLKGQRVLSSFDDHTYKLYRRSEASLATNSNGKVKQDEREQELLALEAALLRESAFRERQAEVDRRTQLEIEARERIRKLEGEIYAERVGHLDAARQKLENVNANISSVDDAIRQYLFQIDFVRDEASIAANIELDWSGIDPLRAIYGNIGRPKPTEDDEHRDTLPPLRSFTTSHDSGSDLAHAHANRQRTSPVNNRKPRSQSALVPRRKGSLNASLAPIHSNLHHPLRHRPRRTYLDPTGTERVDPIKQAELVISFAKDRMQDMGKEKQRTKDELENLIYKIELMIKRKDHVRHWTREMLEKNLAKQSQLDQLVRLDRSNDGLTSLLNLIVWRDNSINVVAQSMGMILRGAFWTYYQIQGEVWFCVKWMKPSSWWCSKKGKGDSAEDKRDDGNGDEDSKENINILDDFGTASSSSSGQRFLTSSPSDVDRLSQIGRYPLLMPISFLVLLVAFGLYHYGYV
ncbi:hypothetical protein I302_109049 [Kwoniella bestiolae CBS 10118]|uniref:Uncharacterized protein n=1 Tax=Kwoniella bestiolae CBS 10118 TaxID=1296100 RepID=A0AAJ8MBJ6_9TREE